MVWPYIDPGEMIHWVAILHQVPSSDISGTTVVWRELFSTWAKIEIVKGSEVIKSGQNTTQLFLTVGIYWQAGIVSNMRVQAQNGLYNIQSIENPLERNVVLFLNCLALGSNE